MAQFSEVHIVLLSAGLQGTLGCTAALIEGHCQQDSPKDATPLMLRKPIQETLK